MGKLSLIDKAKSLIGHIAWKICLWSWNKTEEQYWRDTEEHYKEMKG